MLNWRRKAIVVLVGLILLTSIVIAAILVYGSDDRTDTATLLAPLLAAVAMAAGALIRLASWLRPTATPGSNRLDDLLHQLGHRVQPFWTDEAKQRDLRLPAPITVSWEATRRHAFKSERQQPTQLTQGVVTQLADLYAQLPHPRKLMIIGDGGSGKSAALILLLLRIFELEWDANSRHCPKPLPVLLPLADWDPERLTLRAWAAATLEREHPFLAASGRGGAALELLSSNSVALFLDGLDEMPNATAGLELIAEEAELSIVLTARTELAERVPMSPEMANASIIELLPVDARGAADYLSSLGLGPRHSQATELGHVLTSDPRSPVARALDRPLWLTFARTAYWDPQGQSDGRSPIELSDQAAFPSVAAVRQRLIARTLAAAFRNGPYASSAMRYLRYIAPRSGAQLAWWEFRMWVPRPVPCVGTVLVIAAIGILVARVIDHRTGVTFAISGAVAGCAAVCAVLRVLARGGVARPLDGASPRSFVACILGLLHGSGLVLLSRSPEWLSTVPAAIAVGVIFGIGVGPAVAITGLHGGSLIAAPRMLEGSDALAGLIAGAASALPFLLLGTATDALLVGTTAGLGFAVTAGWTRPSPEPQGKMGPISSFRADLRGGAFFALLGSISFGSSVAVIQGGSTGVVAGVTLGVAGFFVTSQAAALLIVGVVLRRRNLGPINIMGFLENARYHGVLRRVGTRYEFRHAELHDFLRSASNAQTRWPPPRLPLARWLRSGTAPVGNPDVSRPSDVAASMSASHRLSESGVA